VSFIRKYETFAVSMEEKRVDPEIQIDINEMILDYLGFVATENALENYASRGGNDVNDAHGHSITRGLLQLVDCQ